ncbi:hypothetical protein [Algibacter sp. 2305UL17-15]|uniref:hypothetical protein n=1 Tax=Algibacter sp. 2305UL17-15 TaxID=3231268 RepID=UPI003459BEBF
MKILIRKTGYLALGKLFYSKPELQQALLSTLKELLSSDSEKVQPTVINAVGEIGKFHFNQVPYFFLILVYLMNIIH